MEFKCSLCDYISHQKDHIKDHINRKIKCGEGIPTIISVPINISCIFCNGSYSTIPILKRHLKTCKVKKENLEEENRILKEEIKVLKENKIKENYQLKLDILQKKLDETTKLASKLIDKKIIGNVSVETIRSQARKLYKSKFPNMVCVHCKHSGSTQVCHIKPISEFNDFSLIDDVNNIKNLVGLCPNCHIDLDKHKKFEITRTATLHSLFVK
jgi:5-methylcytosine-specific restriction endonuclease McrA